MEIKNIKKEGLAREYSVTMSATAVQQKVNEIIAKEAKTFKMPGFREGKVPFSLVKRQIGDGILQNHLRQIIDDAVRKIMTDSGERPAMSPEIEMNNLNEETELKLTITFDALPAIPEIDLTKISLDSYEIVISDNDIDKAKDEILRRFKNFKPAEAGYKAQIGDALKIDFIGKIDGTAFEDCTSSNTTLEIGAKQFIPGFEEQLVGIEAGEERVITVTFPKDHPNHPSKKVTFDIKVHEVLVNKDNSKWNEELAKKLGLENIEKIDQTIKDRISTEFALMARFHIKKELFDILDKEYSFDIPRKMLNADLQQLLQEVKSKNINEIANKSDEELKAEYEKISSRRVKLGLLLAELARINKVTVTEEDFRETITAQIMQMPNKQKEIIEYYSKQENLRMLEGPILEEKTVDFILSNINLNKVNISVEEFYKKNLEVNS